MIKVWFGANFWNSIHCDFKFSLKIFERFLKIFQKWKSLCIRHHGDTISFLSHHNAPLVTDSESKHLRQTDVSYSCVHVCHWPAEPLRSERNPAAVLGVPDRRSSCKASPCSHTWRKEQENDSKMNHFNMLHVKQIALIGTGCKGWMTKTRIFLVIKWYLGFPRKNLRLEFAANRGSSTKKGRKVCVCSPLNTWKAQALPGKITFFDHDSSLLPSLPTHL